MKYASAVDIFTSIDVISGYLKYRYWYIYVADIE